MSNKTEGACPTSLDGMVDNAFGQMRKVRRQYLDLNDFEWIINQDAYYFINNNCETFFGPVNVQAPREKLIFGLEFTMVPDGPYFELRRKLLPGSPLGQTRLGG